MIDEIQMIKDAGRGWAWTRALLGLAADEIHLCGEPGAIDLVCFAIHPQLIFHIAQKVIFISSNFFIVSNQVKSLCLTTGEDVEIRRYKRLTSLKIEHKALVSLDKIQAGDCIVCFNKNDIYTISRDLEARGVEVAVIYGGLPPNTKLAQAAKFNDPNNPCKVLVATDAIGMGLNL